MTKILDYREGEAYKIEIQAAVRYGYYYRKEAERCEGRHFNACLGGASEILLWIANAVIGGVAYDVIKSSVKKLYKKLAVNKKQIEKISEGILSDEKKLEEFCLYVIEFHEHRIAASDEQIKYIKEEIIADYLGSKAGELRRLPTHEEWVQISRDAFQYADDLLNS